MRAFNDERLAKEAKDIDLILGGHDHEYFGVKRICKIPFKLNFFIFQFLLIFCFSSCFHV